MELDFDRIRAVLDGADDEAAAAPALPGQWLSESWHKPARFWQGLVRYHARLSSPAPKSHPSDGFDFYYDLVLRHRPERVALRSYCRQSGWRSLTIADLDARSTALADDWSQRGLGPGATVCLLLPLGDDFVAALLTALRLGLKVSFLPPLGARFVALRLGELKPDRVITSATYLPLVDGKQTILVSDAPATRTATRRLLYNYAPDAPVGALFSEHVDPTHVPLPLRADHLYLGALRDGLLLLSLRPGDMLAAPGLPLLAHQPTLVLAALLSGATFVHIEPEDLAAEPSLLTNLPLRAVGIAAATRDLLLRAHVGSTRGWAHWFRNPEEPFDIDAWRRFVRQLKLAEVPTSNLAFDAASGGSVLWSLRRRGQVHAEVLPAAGRPWALAALAGATADGSGPQALGDFGLLAARAPVRPPYILLVRAGGQYLYGGTRTPRSGGRVYPAREVAEVARGALPVVAATVVLDRAGRLGQPVRVLVAFTGAARASAADERALRGRIAQALGADFVPDRIELVPLYPRIRDGQIDQRWCDAQQTTGMLYHKPRQPLFQLLTLLRHSLGADGKRRK
jgi:hypothetical protein